jgi:hypothetical protein
MEVGRGALFDLGMKTFKCSTHVGDNLNLKSRLQLYKCVVPLGKKLD